MGETEARNEIDLGLARMSKLMGLLGQPQDAVRSIHVAGTNGKGSTCVFLASILKSAGFKVGLYMSPAVVEPMEVISVNGENISKEVYDELYDEVTGLGAELESEGLLRPTIFEIQTAVAFLFFKRMGCDINVIETGLGGDLDATNVTGADVAAVITLIGLDHMAFLGPKLTDIAVHKSGIIKRNVPVFMAKQEPEVMQVLASRAKLMGSEMFEVCETSQERLCEDGCYEFNTARYQGLKSGLSGSYQVDNAALAVTTLDELRREAMSPLKDITDEVDVNHPKNEVETGEKHLKNAADDKVMKCLKNIDDETWHKAIYDGIENARISCRMERVGVNPTFVFDGAHNPPAAVALRKSLDEAYPDVPKIFIMGAFADKDYMEVARTVISDDICVLTVPAAGTRSEAADVLLEKLSGITGCVGKSCGDVKNAIEIARAEALKYHEAHNTWPVVICFGSLSWLAEAKQAL